MSRRGGEALIVGLMAVMLALLGIATTALVASSPAMPTDTTSPSTTVKSIASGPWSDDSIWSPRPPMSGDIVIISSGTEVIYDLSYSPFLKRIDILGALKFTRDRSTVLTVGNITVEETGYLEVGTRSAPIPPEYRAVIRLAATREGGAKILVWGRLEIHGAPVKPTFTKLAETAEPGDRILKLAEDVNWRPVSHVVITSTSLNPLESEENYVVKVDGNVVELARPLRYRHDGEEPARGEVALLSRNVVITSLSSRVHAEGIMFGYGARAGISYAEFRYLGGKDMLGKYPIHFHHVKQSMMGTVIQGVSIWGSNNRFITIHDTDGITIKDSVGYRAIGHGFFLEDGNEMNNSLINNIAILNLRGRIRPDDARPAGFWVQNPVNRLVDNIAVSALGSGFDLAIPKRAPEVVPSDEENLRASMWRVLKPRRLKILEFSGNEAHSNRHFGLRLYRLDATREGGINWFKELKMWRNGIQGVFITASQANLTSSLFFGNRMGNLRIDARDMTIRDSTILGEILNAPLDSVEARRYRIAPFGLLFTGTRITILNNLFAKHASDGSLASADIIHESRGFTRVEVAIIDTRLESGRELVFGYPLNGRSYIKVINTDSTHIDGFILYRYDTKHEGECKLNIEYMAMLCPLT